MDSKVLKRMERFEAVMAEVIDMTPDWIRNNRFESHEGYKLPRLAHDYRVYCATLEAFSKPVILPYDDCEELPAFQKINAVHSQHMLKKYREAMEKAGIQFEVETAPPASGSFESQPFRLGENMIDIQKLEELAKAAKEDWCNWYTMQQLEVRAVDGACAELIVAASPSAVLELIGEVARSQRMVVRAACDLGAISEALGADMDDDADHLIEMIKDLREERDRLAADNKTLAEDPGSAL